MSKPTARKAPSPPSAPSPQSAPSRPSAPPPTTSRRRGRAASKAPRPFSPSSDAIAQRAYEIFVRRGAAHGHDWDDWLAAERELRVEG
jgi:hypothetical protein